MNVLFRIVTPALLLTAVALGVRAAGREFAKPFEGIERLAKAQVPEVPIVAAPDLELAIEAPPESTRFQFQIESGDVLEQDRLESLKRELNELVALQLPKSHVSREVDYEVTYYSASEMLVELVEFIAQESHDPLKDSWDQWKAQAIAALPEDLRADSEHRKYIEDTFNIATADMVDNAENWIINRWEESRACQLEERLILDMEAKVNEFKARSAVSGLVSGFERFTLMNADGGTTEILLPRHSNSADANPQVNAEQELRDRWIRQWDEWRTQAIAALPESERNNPNHLRILDTTYEEMMRLAPAPPPPKTTILRNDSRFLR